MCCIIVNSYLVKSKVSKGSPINTCKAEETATTPSGYRSEGSLSITRKMTYFRQIPSVCGTWTCHKGNRNPLSDWSRLCRVLCLLPGSTCVYLNIIQNRQLNVITLILNNSSAFKLKQTTQNGKLLLEE